MPVVYVMIGGKKTSNLITFLVILLIREGKAMKLPACVLIELLVRSSFI